MLRPYKLSVVMPRIFLPSSLIETGLSGEPMELDADTSKKLLRVLRLTPGEMFVAFDGLGGEWDCALIANLDEKSRIARAAILNEREVANENRLHISVAQAIPKGDKMEFVLQKGTELGVAEFWPFGGGRSVPVFEDDERALSRAERWRKIALSAAAQCGRAQAPIVHAIGDMATAVDFGTQNSRCFMLDEAGADDHEVLSLRAALQRQPLEIDDEVAARVMVLVGPEGGWTGREREWAERYGAERVGLGRRILRTETAALVAVAVLQWEAGELG